MDSVEIKKVEFNIGTVWIKMFVDVKKDGQTVKELWDFQVSDGEVRSAHNKEYLHKGVGFFEHYFGKKQTRIIKKLCHDNYVKARQVVQCISNIYDFNCEPIGIKQKG